MGRPAWSGAGKASRMLILVRKVQQSIWIEGDISIHVLGIERDRVKLGITAPSSVKVMRQELLTDVDPSAVLVGGAPPANGAGHQ
jgi:carbon storage regulator